MTYLLKRCMLVIAVFILLPLNGTHAAPEFLPVDQIQPGMRGIAKTVVKGTTIEEFGVEVLGVMKDKGPSSDLILVKTYGDIIDRTGGIVQGMSGSPVYINGKLVGAVAYGWPFADHTIGMVTPIADMLKLWDNPDFVNQPPEPILKIEPPNESTTADAVPMDTPLMAAGFSKQALKMLSEKLQPFHMIPYEVGGVAESGDFGPLEPGSAVGVELIRGDISLSALGTVTYAEGDKILAFGHPFLRKGNVGYFMTSASIYTVVNSVESGFKVGTTGQAVGLINQDRSSGIAGQLDRYPSIVPVRMYITDKKLDRTQDYAVQVVQDEQMAPALTATSVFNAVDKTLDRTGGGSAKVSFTITGRGIPGDTLTRENMFYSPVSIGELSVGELFDAMNLLANNKFNAIDIMDVKVNVEVYEERRTASIVSAQTSAVSAKPGDTVTVTVKLKPYRGETITRVVPFTIPQDQSAGMMVLEVRGGGMIPLTQLLLKQQGIDLGKADGSKKSFEEVVKDFTDNDRNNDIVIEVLDMRQELLAAEGQVEKSAVPDKSAKQKADNEKKAPVNLLGVEKENLQRDVAAKSHLTTDYIIDNDTKVMINIVKHK